MRSTRRTLTALLVLAALVAAACGREPTTAAASGAASTASPASAGPAASGAASTASPASAAPAAGGAHFRFGQPGDVVALDPWNVGDAASLLVTRQIFETLVDYDPTGFGVVPKLATKWETSADRRTWTFTLRDGVKFHDGTDLDADAVVVNFSRARSARDPLRPTTPVADDFRSYAELWGGFDDDSVITRVEAKGGTVAFTTKAPFGPFLANLALPTFGLVSPKSMRDDRDGFMLPSTSGVAGTGPFAFRPGGWQKDRQLVLERNAGYWDRGKPSLERVTFRPVADSAARIAELKAGTLDAIRGLSPAESAGVRSDPNLRIIPRAAFNVGYLGLNLSARPFDSLNVRRAVAMAIDRQAIARTIYAGEAKVASQFLVPGMLGYDETVVDFYRYDVAGAKKALADAGFANGVATELWYPPVSRPYHPDPRRIAEAFASDLARVGIRVELRTEDWTSYRRDADAGRFPLWLHGWTGRSGDPDDFLGVLFRPSAAAGMGGGIADGAWSSARAGELLRRAATETDATKRAELYKQTSKLIQSGVPRIPTFHANPLTAASRKVTGFVPHPIGVEAFTGVSLAR